MKTGLSVSRSQVLHALGTAAGLAGLVFVAVKLSSYHAEIAPLAMDSGNQLALVAIAIVYGGCGVLMALAWRLVLIGLGCAAPFAWAYRVYALSQLAKYVPGNIFQFAGRQALGLAAGLGNRPLAKSTFYELLSLTCCGLLFWPFSVSVLAPGLPAAYALAAFAAGCLAVLAIAAWAFGRIGVGVIACHLAFLAIGGLVFATILSLIDGAPHGPDTLIFVGGAYVLAWLAGLLTPGAPAGLGVREAVLLVLLRDVAPESVILFSVVAGRLVSVLADLVFFVAGLLVPARARA